MPGLNAFVRSVARRLGASALVGAVARWLCLGVACAALLVLAERLVAAGWRGWLLVLVPVGASLVAGLAHGLARWPGRASAALDADARLGLDERVSTALAAGVGPMADLVRADAARRAAAVDVRASFAVVLPWSARALPLLVAGLIISVFVPEIDVLGWGAARRQRVAQAAAVRSAAETARKAIGSLSDAARREGLGDVAAELGKTDRSLAELARSAASPGEAHSAVQKAQSELDGARKANERSGTTGAVPPDQVRRKEDLLDKAWRAIARCRRDLESEAPGAGTIAAGQGKKGGEGQPGKGAVAPSLVREREQVPPAKGVPTLEHRLIEARPGAEAAMSREAIPWRYRDAVRRYFSPDET